MGTGVYSLDIELPTLQADDWILDLGDVRESARVRINGQEANCRIRQAGSAVAQIQRNQYC